MHTGGCANAGGTCVYMDSIPIIYACGSDAVAIGGKPLTDVPGIGDGEFDDDRADMSVDLTPALPKAAVTFAARSPMRAYIQFPGQDLLANHRWTVSTISSAAGV